MMRAPRRSMADSFAAGAVSGATTVQGIPRLRAHQATPCAMLPADAVRTPRASCDAGIAAIALAAPRILKEPIGCRFSSLSQISAGDAGRSRRTSGVRRAIPDRQSRAARMSSRLGNMDTPQAEVCGSRRPRYGHLLAFGPQAVISFTDCDRYEYVR